MIPIIRWEINQRRAFIFWWCTGLIVLVAVIMFVYPSIRDQAQQFNQTLQQLPETLRSLKSNSDDLLSPTGYLNAQLYYATLPLLLGIMTISLGSSLLARDEQAHTLEVLLARPISRSTVLAAKALAGVLIVVFVGFIVAATIIGVGQIVGLEVGIDKLLLATFYTLLLSISFGAIAFMLTAGAFARRASAGIATLFAFGGYLLTSLAGLSDWIEAPSKLLPYHYYNPYDILHGSVATTLIAYLLATIVLTGLIAWLSFRKRDIE